MDEALMHIGDGASTDAATRGMPPEAPRPMPSQPLARFDETSRRALRHPPGLRSARWRRLLVLGTSLALAGVAIDEMRLALSVSHLSPLAIAVLVLFAINVTWISLPFVASVIGFLRVIGRRRRAPPEGAPLSTRTALLMPTFNEDPARVAAALDAMAHDLVDRGYGHAFDVFLLSDTTHGDIALREQQAVRVLRRRMGDRIRIYYRRRAENTARKPGNVRDFCERWGSAYDHLLILDADSLMDARSIVHLARRMEADPDAGLIQSVPRLHRGTTLFARLQQFAGSFYGTLLGEGIAWWTGSEGTFWGHNAIVRTEAFTASAGLPVLPGAPPLGGPILSHDFVEAALIRRRGWSVWIESGVEGSYEECPSSLVDQATRDRRWCQGNLQHVRVLKAKGLHWVSRLHLVAGVMSYVSAPFWLLFVASALALGVEYEFARQQYFAHSTTLFPLWPRIDPTRAIRLFGLTMGILVGPKVLGILSVLLSPRRLRAAGGLVRLALGFLLEVLVSALVAPIQALIHCGLVADVLRGRDSGWRAQRRDGESVPWSVTLRSHRWHAVAGVALALVAYAISPEMLAWLAPAVVGMVLAAPLSKLTASAAVGRRVRRIGLLRTPEESDVPPITRAAEAALPVYREAVASTPDLADVVCDAMLLEGHLALTDRVQPRPRGKFDATEALAEKKIREARTIEEAIASLTPEEQARVQALPSLLTLLGRVSSPRPAIESRWPPLRRWPSHPEDDAARIGSPRHPSG